MTPNTRNTGKKMVPSGMQMIRGQAPQYLCLKNKLIVKTPVIRMRGTKKRVMKKYRDREDDEREKREQRRC